MKKSIDTGNFVWLFYLGYIVLLLLTELADLFCYVLEFPQATLLSRVIVCVVFFSLIWWAKGKITVFKPSNSKISMIIFVLFVGIGIIKGAYPDLSMDVSNYHLLTQTPGFMDAFGYHFAPGDFQFFGFRLPDRLFYVFRKLLGFRMGTILNSLVLFLIYLQVRDILEIALGEKLRSLRKAPFGKKIAGVNRIVFREEILAVLIVLTHDAVMQFATYMVDLFAIPVALEMIRILLKKEETSKTECAYYAFLAGLMFCMKMTNVVYVAPLLIYFLVKHWKKLTLPLFVGCFALAMIPVSIYLCYNFLETGNPVFPYYNVIFQSEYFPLENFKDTRWGFSNLKELLFWAFYMVFKPEYRLTEIKDPWSIGALGMFVAAVWFAVNAVRNRKEQNSCTPVYITFIVSYFLWAYTTGHVRYFLFGYILGGIMLIDMVSTVLLQSRRVTPKLLCVTFAVLFAMGPYAYLSDMFAGIEWSWRPVTMDMLKVQWKFVLHDHEMATEETKEKVDAFLLNDYASYGSIAHQIDEDAPIIFNRYVHTRLAEPMVKEQEARIRQLFEQNVGVYDLNCTVNGTLDTHLSNMNDFGIRLGSCEWPNGTDMGNANFLMMKLDLLEDGEQNIWSYANKDSRNQINLNKVSDEFSMKIHAGYTVLYDWYPQENVYLQVKISDTAGHEAISRYPVKMGEFYMLDIAEDLSDFTKEITVDYRLVHGDGSLFDVNGPSPFAVFTLAVTGANII